MIAAGIDVGSVSTKAVLIDNNRFSSLVTATGWSPRDAGQEAYQRLLEQHNYETDQVACIVATGYGRISLPFADKTVTEVTCHARGAAYLVPESHLVIDVGGQDSKVIKIDNEGRVLDFAMNDKCAAGTGRFLQIIAAALGSDVSELGELSDGHTPLALNSMCTVFAESEVIGLLAQGKAKGEIVAGLHQSVARRLASMAQRMGVRGKVTFTGGVACNDGVKKSLEAHLGVPVIVPENCQLAGAIGAALIARELAIKTEEIK